MSYTYQLDMRSRLRAAVRDAWNSPEGFALRDQLSNVAFQYGEALRQWAETSGLRNAYRRIAEATNIRYEYLRAWGKLRPRGR